LEPCYPDKPLGPGGPGKPRWPGGPGGPKGPDGPGEPIIDGGGIVVLVIPTDALVSFSILNIVFSMSLFAIGGISLFAIRDLV
jgi:hypothetical protein